VSICVFWGRGRYVVSVFAARRVCMHSWMCLCALVRECGMLLISTVRVEAHSSINCFAVQRILWPYIERNLLANLGIVGEVLLLTFNRDAADGEKEARDILDAAVAKYPSIVKEVPFCSRPYGTCAALCMHCCLRPLRFGVQAVHLMKS
jgi:hypothetical protein